MTRLKRIFFQLQVSITTVLLAKSVADTACNDSNWEHFNGSCYSFTPQSRSDQISWFAARRTCQLNGGELSSVNSEAEYDFLRILKSSLNINTRTWIGLNRIESINFTWSDGSQFTYGDKMFDVGEPNNHQEAEGCIRTSEDFDRWHDDKCTNERGFLCKRSVNQHKHEKSVASISLNGVCPDKFLSDSKSRKCYFVGGLNDYKRDEKVDQLVAKRLCQSKTSTTPVNLASIQSQAEQDLVNLIMENISADIWIGLHNRHINQNFMWEDYSEMTYENRVFSHILSNNSGFQNNKIKCGKIRRHPDRHADHGRWTVAECDEKNAYLCQTIKVLIVENASRENYTTSKKSPVMEVSEVTFIAANLPLMWEQALASCSESNGSLASLWDMFEMSKVNLAITEMNITMPVWIGLKFDQDMTRYTWADNAPVKMTFWAPGKPSHVGANRCVYMNGSSWSDEDCTQQFPFVCQFRPIKYSKLTKVETSRQLECGEKNEHHLGDSCFLFHDEEPIRWLDAHNRCRYQDMQLASIQSKLENDFIISHLKELNELDTSNNPYRFWIGFYKDIDGRYFWSDDSPVQYVSETDIDPILLGFEKLYTFCFSLDFSSRHWHQETCDKTLHYFICESKAMQTATGEIRILIPSLVVAGVCFTALALLTLIINHRASKFSRQAKKRPNLNPVDKTESQRMTFIDRESHYDYLIDLTESSTDLKDAFESSHSIHGTDSLKAYDLLSNIQEDHHYNKFKCTRQHQRIPVSSKEVDIHSRQRQETTDHGIASSSKSATGLDAAGLCIDVVNNTDSGDDADNLNTSIDKGNIQNVTLIKHSHRSLSELEDKWGYSGTMEELDADNVYITPDDPLPLPHRTNLLKAIREANSLLKKQHFIQFKFASPYLGVKTIHGRQIYLETESNYWIPDGVRTSIKADDVDMEYNDFVERRMNSDLDKDEYYCSADGAYYRSTELYKNNPERFDCDTYAILSDYLAVPIKEVSDVQTCSIGMASGRKTNVVKHNSNFEENESQNYSLPHRDASESDSDYILPIDALDGCYEFQRLANDYDFLLGVYDPHVYSTLLDFTTSYKLYDVNNSKPVRNQVIEDVFGLAMGYSKTYHFSIDNVSMIEKNSDHKESHSESNFEYWIPDGAEPDLHKINLNSSCQSLDTPFINNTDYLDIQSFYKVPKPCKNFPHPRVGDDVKGVSQQVGTKHQSILADTGADGGYWIPDGAGLSDKESDSNEMIELHTLTTVKAQSREDDIASKRLHTEDKHGYSIPVELQTVH